jgi:hypothetical protein
MVGYRLRAELRYRWRAWLGLALLVGILGGVMTAFVAGARRTESAYSRFLRAQHAYDVLVVNNEADGTAIFDFDRLARSPLVAESARAAFGYTLSSPAYAAHDGAFDTTLNRAAIVEGRLPDPRRPEEVAVGFEAARFYDLEIGSALDDDAEVEGGPMRVVGIVAAPGEFPPSRGPPDGALVLPPPPRVRGASVDIARRRAARRPAPTPRCRHPGVRRGAAPARP